MLFIVRDWIRGDCEEPVPSESRENGRNHDWRHFFARDILSMPDKWEYPWFAAWDTAFHMLPFVMIDPDFALSCDQTCLLIFALMVLWFFSSLHLFHVSVLQIHHHAPCQMTHFVIGHVTVFIWQCFTPSLALHSLHCSFCALCITFCNTRYCDGSVMTGIQQATAHKCIKSRLGTK